MKTLNLFILLSLSSLAFADDAAIERYINTHINVMQAQVEQLYDAIFLLSNEKLSDQDTFDKIGQPSFQAVDNELQQAEFTPNIYYQFAHKNKNDIDQWLNDHATKATEIDTLQAELDQLMQEYDQLIKRTAAAN